MKFSQFLQETSDTGIAQAAARIQQYNNSPTNEFHDLSLTDLGLKKIPVQITNMQHSVLLAGKNQLSTFENFPKVSCGMDLSSNNFSSLHNIHKYITTVYGDGFGLNFVNNPINSHVLGLLLIDELQVVSFTHTNVKLTKVEDIIRKYLPNYIGKNAVLDCQNELIDAGLEEFAQL